MEKINVNDEHDKFVGSKMSQTQTGSRSSDRRFYRAVLVCLGLLSLFLLVGLGLGVHYHNLGPGSAADFSRMKINLTHRLQASDNKLSDVSEERDRLKVRVSSLTAETDQLKTRVSSLTAEKEQLKTRASSLTAERDRLNITLIKRTKELNSLQSSSDDNKLCPAGWSWFNFSCYYVSCEGGSWDEGRQDCKDREADLVVIDSDEEQKFISDLTTLPTWIGLTDREEEGTWKWIDGSALTLRQWGPHQPDNGGGYTWFDEDCAHIIGGREMTKNWNDGACHNLLSWICEKKAPQ